MMKDNLTLQWTLLILAGISVIVGIIAKAIPFVVFNLIPPSYLKFAAICLLFSIALSLFQISSKK
jgi:hypothetical protein